MALIKNSGKSVFSEGTALQVRRSSALTGFETLSPLAISTGLFKFLKCLGLNSVGLGLDCVPFHAGWELVEWRPSMSVSEWIEAEFERNCVEIEEEEQIKSVGPQIELDWDRDRPLMTMCPRLRCPDWCLP